MALLVQLTIIPSRLLSPTIPPHEFIPSILPIAEHPTIVPLLEPAIPPIYEPLPSATIVTSTIRLRIIDLFVAYLISP